MLQIPRIVIIVAIIFAFAAIAAAQSTWNNNVTGDWSNAANWNGGSGPVPTSGVTTEIIFDLATTTASNQDVGAPYALDTLTFTDVDSGFDLSGGGLDFSTAAGTINNDDADNNSFTISTALTATNALTFTGTASGTATIDAVIDGTGGVTIAGSVYTFNQANSFTNNVTLSGGQLNIAADDRLGNAANTVTFTGAATLNVTGSFTTTRSLIFNGAGIVSVNGGQIFTIDSQITGTAGVTTGGTGTVVFNDATNNYAGTTTINAGSTLRLGAADVIPDTSTVTVNGTLNMNNLDDGVATIDGSGIINTGTAGGGNLTISNGAGSTFAGSFTGTGGFTLNTGTLTVTGVSSHSGDTVLNGVAANLTVGADNVLSNNSAIDLQAGTLNINNFTDTIGGLEGAAATTVDVGAGQLTFGDDTDRTYAGEFTGSGSLIYAGTGDFTMANTSNLYTGSLTVNDGVFFMNDTFGDGTAVGTVDSNGWMSGTGTFGGDLTVNNVIDPGAAADTVGTYSVSGNYTQGADSFFVVDVANDGTSDRIAVTGNADLGNNGDVFPRLVDDQGTYANTGDYMIMTYGGALTDEFSNIAVAGDAALFTWSLDYSTANEIHLLYERNLFANFAITENQITVANMLDRVSQTEAAGEGDLASVYNKLNTLNPDELREAMDDISPIRNHSATIAAMKASQLVGRSITRRFDDLHLNAAAGQQSPGEDEDIDSLAQLAAVGDKQAALALASVDPMPDEQLSSGSFRNGKWGFWFRVIGDWASHDGTDNMAGFDYDTVGVIFGADYRVLPELVVGGTLSYARTNVTYDSSTGSADIDNLRLGVYGTWMKNGFYADAAMSYGYNWYETHRTIRFNSQTATARHHGCEFQTYLGGGYDWTFGNWIFGPTAALQYTFLHEESYTEDGALSLNLDIDANDSRSLQHALGMRVAHVFDAPWIRFIPEFRAEWLHEYETDSRTMNASIGAPGGSFTVESDSVPADSLLLTVRGNFDFKQGTSAFVNYEFLTEGSGGVTSHAIWGGLRFQF